MTLFNFSLSSLKKKRLSWISLFLLIIIIGLFFLYTESLENFNQKLNNSFNQSLSFDYKVYPGDKHTLIVGDLAGLNKRGYKLAKRLEEPDCGAIVIPSILEGEIHSLKEASEGSIYQRISNTKGIFLADNFCTEDWGKLANKSLYRKTSLSPGTLCNSEPRVQNLNEIIRYYNIEKVIILYNVPSYLDLINNFISYLEENDVKYKKIQNEKLASVCHNN